MWGKFYLAFVIAVISGTIFLIMEVDAKPITDDCACEKQALVSNLLCEYSKSYYTLTMRCGCTT